MEYIQPTPFGTNGVQQSLKERLLIRAEKLIKTSPSDAAFRVNKKLQVKISGDGMDIGKQLHVVNVTFTLYTVAMAITPLRYSKSLKTTNRYRNAFQIL